MRRNIGSSPIFLIPIFQTDTPDRIIGPLQQPTTGQMRSSSLVLVKNEQNEIWNQHTLIFQRTTVGITLISDNKIREAKVFFIPNYSPSQPTREDFTSNAYGVSYSSHTHTTPRLPLGLNVDSRVKANQAVQFKHKMKQLLSITSRNYINRSVWLWVLSGHK